MATIKVCDRCGAWIMSDQEIFQLALERVRTHKYEQSWERHDLCVSCAEKLRVWMEQKEEQDERQGKARVDRQDCR